ncbi:MAG: TetR/AcrR family transcriptional regulator [Bacteroidales bacterium]|nr:TetR/AcrR family transcriptional regulator [Bacteroidales bacterium]
MVNGKIEKTREKILQVADKLFGHYGFYKTSMDEIAKIARKAKGSLYYHFASKEELFKEVVAKEIQNLKHELNEIVNSNLNAKDKIKAYLIKRMQIVENASNYHETLKADFYEHFDFIDGLRNDLDNWEKNKTRQIINEGIENGEFVEMQNTKVILDVFIMVLKGLEIPFFIQGKYKELEPYFDDMLGILIRGISK